MSNNSRFTLVGPTDVLPRLVDAVAEHLSVRVVGPDEPTLRKCLALGAAEAALVPADLELDSALLDHAPVVVADETHLPSGYEATQHLSPPDGLAAAADADSPAAEATSGGAPAAVIYDADLPQPRNPGLKDIMAAKKVEIPTLGESGEDGVPEDDPADAPGETASEPAPATDPAPETEPVTETAAGTPTESVTARPDPTAEAPQEAEAPETSGMVSEPEAHVDAPPRPAARPARRTTARSAAARTSGWVVAAVIVVAVAVAAASLLMTLDPVRDFVRTYPGAAPQPAQTPVGLPGWLGWQHFLNAFFLVLIFSTGLRIRRETRPPATWTSRRTGKKVSLTVWLHQGLDLLWLINGVVFLVMLFATGQWQRLVPTDWEVIPNAVSAGLQYLSLDWPTDNGWVAYNGLQQLTYFVTVFIAAPLAALSGWRMSTVWPHALDRLVPMQVARRVHFPVMIYFVGFVVVHVGLVLSTGMKRNLNHIFAATDAGGWAGFFTFVLALVVMAAGWALARPAFVAPVARVFGDVSSR